MSIKFEKTRKQSLKITCASFCITNLEEANDDSRVLSSIGRRLRPGGKAAAGHPTRKQSKRADPAQIFCRRWRKMSCGAIFFRAGR